MSDYNLKSIKDTFKKNGVFYTPPELAIFMKSFIDIDCKNVYDPTCGDGSLLSIFNDNVKKYGQEINQTQLDVAKNRLVNFEGFCGDTLINPAFLDLKFDCIIANPPFSISWKPNHNDIRFKDSPAMPSASKADYAFILHILYLLNDNGTAVVLNFPGILYRGKKEGLVRQYLIEKNYIEKIVFVEGDTFVDTKIQTALIVFKKNKKNTDIIFEDKKENLKYTASLEEIKKNDFNLSKQYYLKKEIIKEEIDPVELADEANNVFLTTIKANLTFNDIVCDLEKMDKNIFPKQIIQICKQHLINNKKPKLASCIKNNCENDLLVSILKQGNLF